MAIAGSVAPVFRDGGYDKDTIYDFYHALIHNNKLYFCRQDGTIGHEPQEESDEYWFLSLDGNFADAVTLNGKSESELSVANSEQLGGKGASEYVSIDDFIGGSKVSVGVAENKSLDMIYFEFSDGTKKLLKYDNATKRLGFTEFDGSVWSGKDIAYIADLANYLNLGGGTVANHALLSLSVRNTGDNDVVIGYYGIDDILGSIGFNGASNPAFIPQDGSRWYKIFHEGNKPTGSYTGNGSAEQRVINTGGIGWAVVIWGTTALSGVSSTFVNQGGYGHRAGTTFAYTNTVVGFYNGDIILSTDDINLNEAGTTYYYQVL